MNEKRDQIADTPRRVTDGDSLNARTEVESRVVGDRLLRSRSARAGCPALDEGEEALLSLFL